MALWIVEKIYYLIEYIDTICCRHNPSTDKPIIQYYNPDIINSLNTGDLILFKGSNIFSKAIETVTKSEYSHIGIVLKNPTYIDPKFNDDLYFIESGYYPTLYDSKDNKLKLGVMIHLLKDVLNESKKTNDVLYIRKINLSEKVKSNLENNLAEIYKTCDNKPYDINIKHWIHVTELELEYCSNIKQFIKDHNLSEKDAQDCTQFFCSAFVGYVYTKLGILKPETAWSLLSPNDFATDCKDVCFINDCSLCNIITISVTNCIGQSILIIK